MSDELRTLLGERLKTERDRLGLSQSDFAALGGASKRSQIDWEKGALVPNAEFLARMAQHGVDVLYVLTGERSKPPESLLTTDEADLLDSYRRSSPLRRASLREVSLACATAPPLPGGQALAKAEKSEIPKIHVGGDVHQQIEGGATFSAPVSFSFSSAKKRK